MITYEATVAGVGNFDGATAATGSLNFSTHYNFAALGHDVVPVIYSVSFFCGPVGVADLIVVTGAGAYATQLQVWCDRTGLTTWDWACDTGRKLPVTGTVAVPTPWNMAIITANKTQTGSVIVLWRPELVR